jgi:hypothetical protein
VFSGLGVWPWVNDPRISAFHGIVIETLGAVVGRAASSCYATYPLTEWKAPRYERRRHDASARAGVPLSTHRIVPLLLRAT